MLNTLISKPGALLGLQTNPTELLKDQSIPAAVRAKLLEVVGGRHVMALLKLGGLCAEAKLIKWNSLSVDFSQLSNQSLLLISKYCDVSSVRLAAFRKFHYRRACEYQVIKSEVDYYYELFEEFLTCQDYSDDTIIELWNFLTHFTSDPENSLLLSIHESCPVKTIRDWAGQKLVVRRRQERLGRYERAQFAEQTLLALVQS
ncbi:hypothetical protein GOV04_02175 [Candidatus Woesearchaeota archaeon]|nr:hypothetical protein [Candidatus Woesearchaeota archaeon]